MADRLAPGKGFHGVVTADVTEWFAENMNHVNDVIQEWKREKDENEPTTRGEVKGILKQIANNMSGWQKAADSFGLKVYTTFPFGKGEYRITVLLLAAKGNVSDEDAADVRIDVRQFYVPEDKQWD